MTPENVRITLNTPTTKRVLGHWYLRWTGDKYLLSVWRKGVPRTAPLEGTDPQDGANQMALSLFQNLNEFLQQYAVRDQELAATIGQGYTLRPGFRPDYHLRTRTALRNSAASRVRQYLAGVTSHLSVLPERGWPAATVTGLDVLPLVILQQLGCSATSNEKAHTTQPPLTPCQL